jgi:hypothetical protein
MEDMDAFERQLATVMQQGGRASLPVDATAIVHSATTTSPSGRWTVITRRLRGDTTSASTDGGFSVFSALKFVAAGVIVALFGGFLLAGVLTTPQGDEVAPAAVTESPSPTTTEQLLSGMDTVEVEPGVFRVTSDGVRDLTSVEAADIVAGYDGGIWLLREDGFLRLGSDVSHAWPAGAGDEECALEVAPDGTLWVIGCGDPVRSTDGEEWTVQPCPDDSTDCQEFTHLTVAPDGTLWAFDEHRHSVSHLGPAGWQALEPDPIAMVRPLLPPTDAGELYGIGDGWLPVLWRHSDGVWQEQGSIFNVDVGPDGTVWADVGAGWGDPALPDDQVGFARSAGGEWEVWATADILPDIRIGSTYFGYEREVAPDGSLWFSLWRGPDDSGPFELEWWCDGLARFDGETLDRFLPGRCPLMDIAADGSVWLLATDEGALTPGEGGFPDDQTWDLYVITPEAVAATE